MTFSYLDSSAVDAAPAVTPSFTGSTLADLLPQLATMTDADAKGYALVFGDEAHEALLAAQAERPTAQHRAAPVQLTDGRWMLCADLLLETAPGGLYAEGFAALPPELFSQVDVMPFADAAALLPVSEGMLPS
jgi:hypothetical protein